MPISEIVKPPTGRLDSIRARGDQGLPIPLKFKPRPVSRRPKEERDALEKKYEAPPTTRGVSTRRSRGRGGIGFGSRGRRWETETAAVGTASGPFALGSVFTSGRAQKVVQERGRSSNIIDKRRPGLNPRPLSSETSNAATVTPEVNDDDGNLSSSSSDGSVGSRVDVEDIALVNNVKDTNVEGDADESNWGAGTGPPVRVLRRAHVDRIAQVNTDSSLLKRGRSSRVAVFEETIAVKEEPSEDIPGIRPHPKKDKKVQKRRNNERNPKAIVVLSSIEDREEAEREELDRAATLKELIGRGGGADEDGDVDMSSESAEVDDQIFIFQFPPILPQLIACVSTDEGIERPADVDDPTTAKNVSGIAKYRAKVYLRAQQALLESYPPSGIAGKLQIHKSGRMTILWGASDGVDDNTSIEMEVARAVPCDFLQEAVVLKTQSPWGEQDIDETGKRMGAAFSLGQVKGKFVVSPDFGKLLEGDTKRGKGKGKVLHKSAISSNSKTKGKEKET
ncbi:RNA polymerase III RPC4-domain-containing protein [Morchella snyderi]|nr:RNA polymerase III RPC4-domain-containing protein [Morchella snyderi]